MKNRRIGKKAKRRIMVVSSLSITLITLILVNFFSVWNKISTLKHTRNSLNEEMKNIDEEEAYLRRESEKLQDPDYIARYAREKYLFSKKGEFTIIMPD